MIKKILIGLVGFAITFMACYAADVYYNKNVHADNITELSNRIDSTSDRTSALEEKTGTWGAEEWTFVTTEGETIGKPVVVSSEENVFWPKTCQLYWPENYITNNWDSETQTINIPTNFPTEYLVLTVQDDNLTNCILNVNVSWKPNTEKIIEIFPRRASHTSTINRNTLITFNGISTYSAATASSQQRHYNIIYDPVLEIWRSVAEGLSSFIYWGNNTGRFSFPTNAPSTVEEWKEMWLSKQSSSNN